MNKGQELAWIQFFRTRYPGKLPDGSIRQPGPPAADILIEGANSQVAIEVTQIMPDKNLSIRNAQRRAVEDARRAFEGGGRPPVFVNVSFASGVLPKNQTLVDELSTFVAVHTPCSGETFKVLAGTRESRELPWWMEGISIFEPHREDVDWVGGSVWNVDSLTQAQVEQAITRKAQKLDGYRRHHPDSDVWLLLVVDQTQLAADLTIPRNADGWRFAHEFDRVILASAQDFLEF